MENTENIRLTMLKYLRAKRKEKHLSIKDVAKKIGYSQAWLMKVEKGVFRIKNDVLKVLCDEIGVDFSLVCKANGSDEVQNVLEQQLREYANQH